LSESGTLGLEGRTIIITGAARGIGLAAVERFAAERCRILAFDLDGSDFKGVKEIAARTHGEVVTIVGDVSREADWGRAMDTALNDWGRVDVLFNNAGISGPTLDVTRYPVDAFDRVIDVNVRGVFLGMKYAAQHMKTRGSGVIINVSSISGSRGGGNIFGYTASKHAVNGMTQSAAVSLARHGVRVVAVCPCPTGTEMMYELERRVSPHDPVAARPGLAAGIPMKRYGEPHEIINLVAFLASDQAAFMTGALVPVDGGCLAD
jgi:NAD(P)-dependent dehydrogenase (short-subunit alcohol dehydrogenase family)